jgi:hypothetical protein
MANVGSSRHCEQCKNATTGNSKNVDVTTAAAVRLLEMRKKLGPNVFLPHALLPLQWQASPPNCSQRCGSKWIRSAFSNGKRGATTVGLSCHSSAAATAKDMSKQVADSSEQNGSFKMAVTAIKRAFLKQSSRSGFPLLMLFTLFAVHGLRVCSGCFEPKRNCSARLGAMQLQSSTG